MQKNVPTLLGILILLVVVVLVVLIYNIKLTQQLGTGATPTGTLGGEVLTGEKAPTTMLPPAGPGGSENKPTVVHPKRGGEPGAGRPGSAGRAGRGKASERGR